MIVLMCEGKTEAILMERLLQEGVLSFTRKNVFDRRPIHMRQLTEYEAQLSSVSYTVPLRVLRIGDTQRDELNLDHFARRVSEGRLTVEKICTKPEIEYLAVIAKGWISDYNKCKHKIGPKEYLRQHHPSFDFIDYLKNGNIEELVCAIKEYRRTKKHGNDEHYLADLLK